MSGGTWAGSTASVSYTANGNISGITVGGSATFSGSYNAANRLSSLAGASSSATAVYNGAGQRFSKTDSGSPGIYYGYGLSNELLEEQNNGTVTDYIYVNGRPIGLFIDNGTSGTVYYTHTDLLGTPQLVTPSTGATTEWATLYQPYGTTTTPVGSINQNLRLPGQYADWEDGFYYNLNRDYIPATGRYAQADPIGLAGGANPYRYADGNPETYTDTWGLLSQAFGDYCASDNPMGGPYLTYPNGTPVFDPNTGIPYSLPVG